MLLCVNYTIAGAPIGCMFPLTWSPLYGLDSLYPDELGSRQIVDGKYHQRNFCANLILLKSLVLTAFYTLKFKTVFI